MSLVRRTAATLSLACVMSFGATSWAQTPGQDPVAARQFAMEGIAASQRSDWPTVISRFEQAEQRFHAPVHMRYLAVAYERSNRLLDAANMWRRLAAEQLAPTAPQPFRDAVAEAQRELPRIEGRLGRVQIDWPGSPQGATFELDGTAIATTNLSTAQWVEPGAHRVTAHATGRPDVSRSVDVAAGATVRVPVAFAAAVAVVDTEHNDLNVAPQTTTVVRPNSLRTVGFVIAGVGAAATIGGVITGVMASSAFSTLETNCPNRMCTTMAQLDDASKVNGLATVTNALLIGGAALVVGGVVLAAVSGPRVETIPVRVSLTPVSGSLTVNF